MSVDNFVRQWSGLESFPLIGEAAITSVQNGDMTVSEGRDYVNRFYYRWVTITPAENKQYRYWRVTPKLEASGLFNDPYTLLSFDRELTHFKEYLKRKIDSNTLTMRKLNEFTR